VPVTSPASVPLKFTGGGASCQSAPLAPSAVNTMLDDAAPLLILSAVTDLGPNEAGDHPPTGTAEMVEAMLKLAEDSTCGPFFVVTVAADLGNEAFRGPGTAKVRGFWGTPLMAVIVPSGKRSFH